MQFMSVAKLFSLANYAIHQLITPKIIINYSTYHYICSYIIEEKLQSIISHNEKIYAWIILGINWRDLVANHSEIVTKNLQFTTKIVSLFIFSP